MSTSQLPSEQPVSPDSENHQEGTVKTTALEKERPKIVVETPAYRLQVAEGMQLSSLQQARWEAALWAGTILQMRLRAPSSNSATEIFTNDILPVVGVLNSIPLNDKTVGNQTPADVEAAVRQQTRALQDMLSISSLAIDQVQRTITIERQQEGEISAEDINQVVAEDRAEATDAIQNEQEREQIHDPMGAWDVVLDLWVHDLKGGSTTAADLAIQLAKRAKVRIAQVDDAEKKQDLSDRAVASQIFAEKSAQRALSNVQELLEAGMPFSEEMPLFPKEEVAVGDIFDLLEVTIAEYPGMTMHMNKGAHARGGAESERSVLYNRLWLKRMLQNLVSNANKAYSDLENPGERDIDVHIEQMGANLAIVIGDRAKGYPDEMLEMWEDPATRVQAKTGWVNSHSTGLGLREQAAVLEEMYGGKVSLHFSPHGGAATMLQIPFAE